MQDFLFEAMFDAGHRSSSPRLVPKRGLSGHFTIADIFNRNCSAILLQKNICHLFLKKGIKRPSSANGPWLSIVTGLLPLHGFSRSDTKRRASILMSGEFKGQGWQRPRMTERSKPASSKTSSISVFFSNISCNCLFLLRVLHSFVLFSNIFISPQVASGYIAGVTIQSKPEDHSSRFNMIPVSPSFFLNLFDEYRLQGEYVQDKLYS